MKMGGPDSSLKLSCASEAAVCGGDCDDTDPTISPIAIERCNSLDNDCNGTIDDNAIDAQTFYTDRDGNGYSLADQATVGCNQPPKQLAGR